MDNIGLHDYEENYSIVARFLQEIDDMNIIDKDRLEEVDEALLELYRQVAMDPWSYHDLSTLNKGS